MIGFGLSNIRDSASERRLLAATDFVSVTVIAEAQIEAEMDRVAPEAVRAALAGQLEG